MSDVQRVWMVKECCRCGEEVEGEHECKEEALEALRRKYSQRRVG